MENVFERNADIFAYFFIQKEYDFGAWVEGHLDHGTYYPFVMGGREEYELGDLLITIVTNCPDQRELVQDALIRTLQLLSFRGRDLGKIAEVAFAAARAGLTPFSRALADFLELTDEILEGVAVLSVGAKKRRSAQIILAFDVIIASFSGLALKTDDPRVTDACRKFFYNTELAMFSSLLFAPVALRDLEHALDHWNHVTEMATTRMTALGVSPRAVGLKSKIPGKGLRYAYFDLPDLFKGFEGCLVERHIPIEQIPAITQIREQLEEA